MVKEKLLITFLSKDSGVQSNMIKSTFIVQKTGLNYSRFAKNLLTITILKDLIKQLTIKCLIICIMKPHRIINKKMSYESPPRPPLFNIIN